MGKRPMNTSQRARWLIPSPPIAVDGGTPERGADPAAPVSPGDASAPPPNVRVVRQTEAGAWRVLAPGSVKASAVCETRDQAVARAIEILRKCGGGELRVQAADETVIASRPVAGAAPLPKRRGIHRAPRGSFSL
jgi:hypothetical protein